MSFGLVGSFGVAWPQYDGETGYDYYIEGAVCIGAYAHVPLGVFHLRPEVLYSERGHNWEPQNADLSFNTKIKGLEVNALFPWEMGNLTILAGLSSTLIIDAIVYDNVTDDEYSIGDSRDFGLADNLNSVVLGSILGMEYRLDQFLVGVRWVNDINDVYTESWDRAADMRYGRGLFTVGYGC